MLTRWVEVWLYYLLFIFFHTIGWCGIAWEAHIAKQSMKFFIVKSNEAL